MSQQTSSERSPKVKETNEQRALPVLPVRDTVLFASVLFLVALAQRLRIQAARVTLTAFSFATLAYVLVSVLLLPRI